MPYEETVVQNAKMDSNMCAQLILRFSSVLRANFKGTEKKTDSPKHPFGRRLPCTTPSPLLWHVLIYMRLIVHPELRRTACLSFTRTAT